MNDENIVRSNKFKFTLKSIIYIFIGDFLNGLSEITLADKHSVYSRVISRVISEDSTDVLLDIIDEWEEDCTIKKTKSATDTLQGRADADVFIISEQGTTPETGVVEITSELQPLVNKFNSNLKSIESLQTNTKNNRQEIEKLDKEIDSLLEIDLSLNIAG